jgi:hypothetical protein
LLSLQQLRLQTRELAAQTDIRTAEQAFNLMRMLSDLGTLLVEHPEIAPSSRRASRYRTTGCFARACSCMSPAT